MAIKTITSKTMSRNRRLVLSLVSGILFAFIIGIMLMFTSQRNSVPGAPSTAEQAVTKAPVAEKFSYQGKAGVDALTLLKNAADTQLDTSGMVVSINGRKADTTKHEFWSFYVNGVMAKVGPASYITKDTDQVEWRIETY